MSKKIRPILFISASFLLILHFFTFSAGQDIEVDIKAADGKAKIRGFLGKASSKDLKSLWFLDEYAGIRGLLTKRFSVIDFYDKQGYLIARRRFTAVDGFTTTNVGGFAYTVDIRPSASAFAAAHVSWINDHGGVLMLNDLLPQSIGNAIRVKLQVPAGWKVTSADLEIEPGVFAVADVEKAVFYVGSNIREISAGVENSRLKMSIAGEWLFSDTEAASIAVSIFNQYERQVGRLPDSGSRVWISKFPGSVGPGNWEADTRGRSVTLLSSDMPFKTQSTQRLHEQLRHEIFHLWIPNGVNLTGNYDWFYEGFALYQSLKMGVGVNRIRFDDYLDTLSRAYDIDSMPSQQISLIDASKNRWSGANTRVYARGMLVAFLCDLAMLDASKGKRSTDDILREVYSKHGGKAAAQDGNTAVLAILRQNRELVPIAERFITGSEKLDWARYLQTAGLEAEVKDQVTRLKVTAKPSGRQKDLLDKLGYNSWRKLAKGN